MLEVSYIPHASTLGLYFGSGEKSPPRTGNRHSGMAEAPYNVYPAADGWLAIICVSETHWRSLLSAIGRPELHEDPRFVSLKARVAHIEEVDEMISTVTRTMPRDELFALLTTHRVPCAPVRDIDEVVNDPHLHARGMLRHVNHPELGELVLPNSPIRYDGEVPDEIIPSKTLGADNGAVYGDWLGLDAAELAQLKADGVV
jgi:CoA:oxalate CoA-transferase